MQSSAGDVDACIDRIRAVYAGWTRDTPIEQMRSDWDHLFPVHCGDSTFDGIDAGGVSAHWIQATSTDQDCVLLYFHGGGYRLGSSKSHRDLMLRLSEQGGCRVLGINYRLMPEHRFPAPIEDALSAYQWLLDSGVPASRIALAGDSAGGGMVASLMLALRDRQLPLPAAGIMLSALTDFATSGASYETRAESDPIHQRAVIQGLARAYLGKEGNLRDPLASPLYGELSGLPPLLIQVGDRETGLDDSVLFHEAALAAGVDSQLEVWDGQIHVFQQFAAELLEARDAIARIGRFLRNIWSRK